MVTTSLFLEALRYLNEQIHWSKEVFLMSFLMLRAPGEAEDFVTNGEVLGIGAYSND
jgi:hypothetical protein